MKNKTLVEKVWITCDFCGKVVNRRKREAIVSEKYQDFCNKTCEQFYKKQNKLPL